MKLWPALLLLILLLSMLTGCETRTLQSCLASVVLLGPAEITLQCPPRDFYARQPPSTEDKQ